MPQADPKPRAGSLRVHGGADPAELAALGIDPALVLDASNSVSPLGAAPAVEHAIRTAPIDAYPDPTCSAARAALARACGTGPERVVVGSGATDLLWTVARVLLAPGDTLLSCEPAFSELRAAAELGGARVVACRADERARFRHRTDEVVRSARQVGARVVALCAPSSPTGDLIRAASLARIAARHAELTLVLDQSFLALSRYPEDRAVAMPDNVVCVRSLTKEHAIPGVRVGYLVAAPGLARRIESARPAWSVSTAAQAAAVAAVAAEDFVARARARLLAASVELEAAVGELGYELLPSQTTYFVVRVGDARAFRRALLEQHRVLVRDCSSFGMPAWVRVGARAGDEMRRIVAGFADLARDFATGPARPASAP